MDLQTAIRGDKLLTCAALAKAAPTFERISAATVNEDFKSHKICKRHGAAKQQRRRLGPPHDGPRRRAPLPKDAA